MSKVEQFHDPDALERHMLTLPQVECPVQHIFGPGIYIRQVEMKAGLVVKGHHHKNKSLNVVLSGTLALLEDGVVREVSAPYIFTGEIGAKLAYVVEDCVFQNIFATEETDIEKLEAMLVEPSEAYKEHKQMEHDKRKEISA